MNTDNKESKVQSIFTSVASKYDLMNDLMSFGLHRLWKRRLITLLNPKHEENILDIASGTGDLALLVKKKAPKANITLLDLNQSMLEIAKSRFIDSNIISGTKFIVGNAENLPFANESYDKVISAFGIRNVSNMRLVFSETARILKNGGKFICMEFNNPKFLDSSGWINSLYLKFYDFYSRHVIPEMGQTVANDKEAYEYLVNSIRELPSYLQIIDWMKESGFENVSYEKLNGGVVGIYCGSVKKVVQ